MGTILECQICESNGCHFTRCSNSLFGSIFCKSIFNTSTSGNNDTGQSPLTTDTRQISGNLILSYTCRREKLWIYFMKILLPLFFGYKLYCFRYKWRFSFENILTTHIRFYRCIYICSGCVVLHKVIILLFASVI